jgi:hypothetical protein
MNKSILLISGVFKPIVEEKKIVVEIIGHTETRFPGSL